MKDNIFYEDLCYQSQQAVEKALKGLLYITVSIWNLLTTLGCC